MNNRFRRAKGATRGNHVTPSQKIFIHNILKSIVFLFLAAVTLALAQDALRKQNEYVNRVERVPSVDSWSYVLRESPIGSTLIRRHYLDRRPEASDVTAIKAAMPGVFDGFYFDNTREMYRFSNDFLGDSVRFDLLKNELQYGLVIDRSFCITPSDLGACYQNASGQKLSARETSVLVEFLSEDFDELFFARLQYAGFDAVRPTVEQISPLIINGDFEFFTAGIEPQVLSKWLIIVGFFQAMGNEDASELQSDLSLFYFSPVDRAIEERINNPALKIYRGAIESYYRGCFDETIQKLDNFRSLTSNRLLEETSFIFEARAIIRPLFRNYNYQSYGNGDSLESLGDLEYCGRTYSQDKLLERARVFFSRPIAFDREHYQDDFQSLEAFFEEYRREFHEKVGRIPVQGDVHP